MDHAVNSGGKTIALSEVELLLRPFLKETTYVACGIKDPKGVLGDVVALAIEGEWKEALPWTELRIHLFEIMEPLLVPAAGFAVPELPRTSNQKVKLGALREALESGQYSAL